MSLLLSQHNLEITKIKPMVRCFLRVNIERKIKSGRKKLIKGAIIGLLSNLYAFFKHEFSSQLHYVRHKKVNKLFKAVSSFVGNGL